MTSKPVGSLAVVTSSELKALLKLVQLATHQENKIVDREVWKSYCMRAFDWTPETAEHIIHNLRRMANRELANAD